MPGGPSAPRPRGFVRQLKDAAISGAAQRLAAEHLEGIAEVSCLEIDSQQKHANVTGRLAGGGPAFEIRIQRYVLENTGGRLLLTIHEAAATPCWLQAVLKRLVLGRTMTLIDSTGPRHSRAAAAFARLAAALL